MLLKVVFHITNVVYNIIAENIFQFILYSYFTSHKIIIQEISWVLNLDFYFQKNKKNLNYLLVILINIIMVL